MLMVRYDLAERRASRSDQAVRLAALPVLASPALPLARSRVRPQEPGASYRSPSQSWPARLSYFLWSSDARRRAVHRPPPRRAAQATSCWRPRSGGCSRTPAASALVRELPPASGSRCGASKTVDPGPKLFPPVGRAAAETAMAPRDGAVLRRRPSRRPQRARFPRRRLHVRQRPAGAPLRHRRHRHAHFRVPAPASRGGVLTQASILTLTSNPDRTAPSNAANGCWNTSSARRRRRRRRTFPSSTRKKPRRDLPQTLENHRTNAICASCHARMDPLGFGLENFDAIGDWRTKDDEFEIDASGELPDGRKFRARLN